jgi:hypothetical protein
MRADRGEYELRGEQCRVRRYTVTTTVLTGRDPLRLYHEPEIDGMYCFLPVVLSLHVEHSPKQASQGGLR